MREDYTDGQGHIVAVQYEILQEGEEVPCQPERNEGEDKAAYRARVKDCTSSSSRDYLHLLGPDTLRPALRPALRALQCPVPARRRRQLREELGYPGRAELRNELQVTYNDHGLLSLATYYEEDYEGAVHPGHNAGAITYDLRTGRALTIASLIRPGTDTTLCQLISKHLEPDENPTLEELLNQSIPDSTSALLPQLGLGIKDEGVEFTYSNFYDSVTPPVTLPVPYPEQLLLLRPDSPVARMLRERGLWRAGKKK